MHIVVVDDSVDLAESLAELLEALDLGITTEVGYNGEQAVAIAASSNPDLMILDINMPVLDGISAAATIRQAGSRERPTLIAMTGNDVHGYEVDLYKTFDHVLSKPLDMGLLIRVLGAY